jgi:hypothetical protein
VLGADVGGLKGAGDNRVDTGHVDNSPPTVLFHTRQNRPNELKGRYQHHLNHGGKSFLREFLDVGDVLESGIVDQDIDSPPTLFKGGRGKLANRGWVTEVSWDELCAYLTGQIRGSRIDIMKKHPSLQARKGLSDGSTNSTSGTGNKDGFRTEIHFLIFWRSEPGGKWKGTCGRNGVTA